MQQNPFGPGGAAFQLETLTPLSVVLSLVHQAVQTFLGIGLIRMNLSAARGENPELGQLFSGGPWFWRVIGFWILCSLAVGLGLVLLIIPGLILILMWWPAQALIIDNRAGVMDSFKMASEITKGNWGTALVLVIASIGVMLLGMVALCIGVIAAVPFTYLMWTSAYLLMSGQIGRVGDMHEAPMDYGFDQDFAS